MAQTFFADAWYFIALLEPRDTHHRNALQDRGITHVLTNDHHFRQEGFTVLSDAP